MDYVPGMVGTLVRVSEDENARFRFEIWFDYTRQGINLVREGAMLAVPNFASSQREQRLSILEVVTILPMHYGLGDDTHGYPGFVVEAARSAANDWEAQESEATEDTTKIKCIAIPTNFEIVQTARAEDEPRLDEESNIPMLGSTARLLDTAFTQFVINRGIAATENTATAGVLIRDENVKVLVRIQDLLRTHFGIFGFTGAGKSNLVSTLLHNLLTDSREPVKIVIFDLMSEYSTLLLDDLHGMDDAMLIGLGAETFPNSLVEHANIAPNSNANERRESLGHAVRDMVNTTLLPPALADTRRLLGYPTASLIEKNKVRIWRDRSASASAVIAEARTAFKGNMGTCGTAVHAWLDQLESEFGQRTLTEELLEDLLQRVSHVLQSGSVDSQQLTPTARTNLTNLRARVERNGRALANQPEVPQAIRITLPDLVKQLNDRQRPGLYIIQAHNPDLLRHFAWMLGNFTYEDRRRSGQIAPLVSFVFDEADEFIPQGAKETYLESSEIAMTLARRGRKFGLGIGIATQRVIYLNTSIMAQPHTYLVSKMPRQSDRDRISEAFGASEDVFRQTFKFKKGDWLLMSYDATGLEAIPIPIHTEDANRRLRRFLDGMQQQTESRRAQAQRAGGGSSA
ncbi:MAG: ATP-binding protein [Terriglobales bacterium]